jgi:hypothetical protein
MTWLAVGIVTILLVEVFLRLPLISTAGKVLQISQKAAHIMRAKGVSDHWKERAIQAYSGRLLKASFLLIIGLGVIFFAGYLLTLGAEQIAPGTLVLLLSFWGIVFSVVIAILYVYLRQLMFKGKT